MVIISHQERIISLADEILVIDKRRDRAAAAHATRSLPTSSTAPPGGCPVIYGEAKK